MDENQTQHATYRARIKTGTVEFEVEGDKKFVEQHIGEWKKKLFEGFVANSNIIPGKPPAASVSEEKTELGDFYVSKKPNTNSETIATFAYYFDKYEGKRDFSHKDILEACDRVRIPRPTNIHDALSKSYKRNQYIIPSDKKGFWRLSRVGMETVERLPGSRKEAR